MAYGSSGTDDTLQSRFPMTGPAKGKPKGKAAPAPRPPRSKGKGKAGKSSPKGK